MSGTHQNRTLTSAPATSATASARSGGSPAGRDRQYPGASNWSPAVALASCSAGSTCPGKNRLLTVMGRLAEGIGGCWADANVAHSSAHTVLHRDVLAHWWKYSGGLGTITTTCGSCAKSVHWPASDSNANSA